MCCLLNSHAPLVPQCLLLQVKSRLQKMGPLASMNIFLRQEIDRMQRVITIVRLTLVDLKLAIEGTIIMSEVRQSGAAMCTKPHWVGHTVHTSTS